MNRLLGTMTKAVREPPQRYPIGFENAQPSVKFVNSTTPPHRPTDAMPGRQPRSLPPGAKIRRR